MFLFFVRKRRLLLFFFGCGAPFLADVSDVANLRVETRGGGKAAVRAKSAKMDEIERFKLEAVDTRAMKKLIILCNVFLSI